MRWCGSMLYPAVEVCLLCAAQRETRLLALHDLNTQKYLRYNVGPLEQSVKICSGF